MLDGTIIVSTSPEPVRGIILKHPHLVKAYVSSGQWTQTDAQYQPADLRAVFERRPYPSYPFG
jgi:hypothetical protein